MKVPHDGGVFEVVRFATALQRAECPSSLLLHDRILFCHSEPGFCVGSTLGLYSPSCALARRHYHCRSTRSLRSDCIGTLGTQPDIPRSGQ